VLCGISEEIIAVSSGYPCRMFEEGKGLRGGSIYLAPYSDDLIFELESCIFWNIFLLFRDGMFLALLLRPGDAVDIYP
jgi:hypothetical protein